MDLVGRYPPLQGWQECNNETFSTLNFKISISALKFKFSIKFAFAIYLGGHKKSAFSFFLFFFGFIKIAKENLLHGEDILENPELA